MSGIVRKLWLLVVAAALALAFAPATAASAAVSTFGYQGSAFGTSVTAAGGVVTSGKTAPIVYGCGTPAGFHKEASSASLSVPALLSTGTTVSTGDTDDSPTTSTTSSTIQSVNALGGLVTATAVKSVATATHNGSQYGVNSAGTTFTSLSVLGVPIALNPAPNTRITLPLVGHVTINEQRKSVTANSSSIRVTAIHVVVTLPNLLGFPVGTNIVVGQASAALTAPSGGFLGGFAYGTQVTAAGLLTSSPTFRIGMACEGTNGQLRDNTGVGVNLPLILNSGTIANTAQGTVTATTANGQLTSTIQNINLLNGLVTATGIKSVATANRSAGVNTFSSAGSTFATITVAGTPLVVADIAPNTQINLVGVGTVYLHRVLQSAAGIEVRMIEIVVKVANLFGLPIGARILVAVANATVKG